MEAPVIPDLSHIDAETRRLMYLRAVDPLWRRGNLKFKLDAAQILIYDALNSTTEQKFFLLCSRRFGKSFILTLMCFEQALKKPGSRILYLAPWAKDAADIAGDIALTILEDCPEDLKPKYNAQAKEMTFPNGSVIRFKGTNGEHAQYLRGGASELVVLDECGLMDDLKHVVSDVVMPMTLTTGGRIILATTPARSPGHDSKAIYDDCADRGAVAKFTILDNFRVPDSRKAIFLREAGEKHEDIPDILAGKTKPRGTTALREYFVEWVTDANTAVLPEWDEEAQRESVYVIEPPPFRDCYVAIDPGFNDKTGGLFAYWDFVRGKLVIEDEFLLAQASTLEIGEEIVRKEHELWGDREPYRRVSDIDLRLIKDLWESHKLKFVKAEKQDSLGGINLVRTMIQQRELVINPRCTNLIRQMRDATWNRKATDFERAGDTSPDGHYDLVAALKYLCRAVNRTRNPYPPNYFVNRGPSTFASPRARLRAGNQLGLLTNTPFARRITRSGSSSARTRSR